MFYGFGMRLYDLLAGRERIGRSRTLDRGEVLERLRNIDPNNLTGGVLYRDGQFDDTRLLNDILRTAENYGAVVLNYARVNALKKNAGVITGVEFDDLESGTHCCISSKAVINATGAFSFDVQQLADETLEPVITYSRGVHVVLDRKFLPGEVALMIPKTKDGRVLFCIPWKDHVLVGTTDTPVETAVLEPRAVDTEIGFILETASEYLVPKPTRSDILSVFAGIRPLVKTGSATKTSSLSRGHHLFVDASGLVTITGGKWTTYRRMAEDAVDQAAELAGLERRASVTADLPIEPPSILPDSEKLHPEFWYTQEDVIRAVRDEMARTVEDVLARRTRVLFLNAKVAIELAPKVAEIMAEELNRDQRWIERQIEDFVETANNYRI
jgi:glycerol-3-phosphate dehydrogenase